MIAVVTGFLSGAWGKVAIVLALIVALTGGYLLIKQSGVDAERAAIAIQGEKDNATAGRVRSEVDGLSDSAVSERLRQFQRK